MVLMVLMVLFVVVNVDVVCCLTVSLIAPVYPAVGLTQNRHVADSGPHAVPGAVTF